MLVPFHLLKVAQASAVLLKTEPAQRMSRLRLLKLLYIADREALVERSRPITGDQVVAMDHGPVLSHIYDLIKGSNATPHWDQWIHSTGRDVELGVDPGEGKLTTYEIAKLRDVAERFKEQDDWTVAEYTHQFPEWMKNQPARGSSRQIPLDDLLEATGRLPEKSHLLEVERAEMEFDQLISDAK